MPLFVQSKDGGDLPSTLEDPTNLVKDLEDCLKVIPHSVIRHSIPWHHLGHFSYSSLLYGSPGEVFFKSLVF